MIKDNDVLSELAVFTFSIIFLFLIKSVTYDLLPMNLQWILLIVIYFGLFSSGFNLSLYIINYYKTIITKYINHK